MDKEPVIFTEDLITTGRGAMRILVSPGRGDVDLILVHGLIVNSSFMQPTAELLADRFRVIVPDLIGHGRSETPDSPTTIEQHAAALVEALEVLQVAHPVVVGGSFGCQVAVELANRIPVESLIFIGPTAGGPLPEAVGDLCQDALREPPQLIADVLAEVAHIGPTRVIELLKDMNSYPFQERLCNLHVPSLVITGEHDPFFSPDFMDETAKALDSCRAICMPDKPHGLPFSEPEAISSFISDFIEKSLKQNAA